MLRITRLAEADLGLILSLQERIYAALEDQSIFQKSTEEFISCCLGSGGACYAVFDGDGRAVAYRMVYFPRDRSNNLGRDLGLPLSEWPFVAHWDTVAVLEEFRGRGLSAQLNRRALDDLAETEFRHLCATTSPFNPYGLESLLGIGFTPRKLAEKYNGKLRLICYRSFPEPNSNTMFRRVEFEKPPLSIPLGETDLLRDAFARGYAGTATTRDQFGVSLRLHPTRCVEPSLPDLPAGGLEPSDWSHWKRMGRQMVDDMFDYLGTVRDREVWRPVPEAVRGRLRQALPQSGEGLESAYREFVESVLAYPRGNIHPRYWGWVNGSGIPAAVLADFLASAMNATVGAGENAAMMVEEQVIEWMKAAFDWPHGGSGLLTSGSSMSNVIALAAARHHHAGFDVRADGLAGRTPLVVYCSTETHHSVAKAAELLGIGRRGVREIAVDGDRRIRLEELRTAILRDRSEGRVPICVVGNAGTVNTGAVDPLQELGDLCRQNGLWFHIDGAFGAFAWLSEAHRPILRGLGTADSLAFDMHKWMYLPYDVSCVLTRTQLALESTFRTIEAYNSPTDGGPAAYAGSFSDRGIEQSRRLRALKVWFALKVHGLGAFAKAIEGNIEQTRYLVSLLEGREEFEVCSASSLNVVCFRCVRAGATPRELDRLNRDILRALQTSGRAMPSHTILDGRFVMRVANTNHRTVKTDFDFLVRELLERVR